MVYGAERIWVENSLAYLAGVANDGGLIVVDVSDPTAPRWLGRYHDPTCAESVTVSGSYAYLAHGDQGLEIIDRAWLFAAEESWTPPVISRGLLYVMQNKEGLLDKGPKRLLCFDLRGE